MKKVLQPRGLVKSKAGIYINFGYHIGMVGSQLIVAHSFQVYKAMNKEEVA